MTDYLKPGCQKPAALLQGEEVNSLRADRHRLHYLALAGKDMRRKQTRYFRTKDPKAKQQYLKDSIAAEQHFDKECAAIIAGQESTLPMAYIQKLLNPGADEQPSND